MTVVVVAGIPGSGKTTLAAQLGAALDVSVISKDVIKEAMMDVLGSGDVEWASKLSRTSHRVMYQIVRGIREDVILEAHFHRGEAEPELQALARPLVQVYCRCPVAVALARYESRRDDPNRHPGHRPDHQDDKATLRWRTTPPRPLDLDVPLVEVNTATPVDVEAVVANLRSHIGQHTPRPAT